MQMLTSGNVFNMTTWGSFGAAALFITIKFKEHRRQWLIACVCAPLVGAIDAVVIFRLAMASHSSTGGPILAARSPFIGLQAALIAFPLIWGLAGLVMGIW